MKIDTDKREGSPLLSVRSEFNLGIVVIYHSTSCLEVYSAMTQTEGEFHGPFTFICMFILSQG